MVNIGTEQPSGRLHTLRTEAGRFELAVEDGLPACLDAANRAVCQGRWQEARNHLGPDQLQDIHALLEGDPERTDIMFILAKLFFDLQDLEQAEYWFRRIIAKETPPIVYHHLSQILFLNESRWSEAAHLSRMAYDAAPENLQFRIHWAHGLVRTGAVQQGLRAFQEILQDSPDLPGGVQTSYLWFNQYTEEMSYRQINEGYRAWARRYAPPAHARGDHANTRDPERRMRIGYISPDFRRHAVNAFFEPVLDGRDREQVEVFGYGQVRRPDRTTHRLKSKFDAYRDITDQDATQVADRIEADAIDILVELGGHVTDARLDVLALKPAPLQVDFGGISTTGMPQVDYRITDALYDPPQRCGQYLEHCVHLPGGLSAFRPPSSSPPVGPLPALDNGFVTFGSMNSHTKISPGVLDLWVRLLHAIPTARLILKFYAAADPVIRAQFARRFEAAGIASGRIRIMGMLSYTDHMRLLNQIDMLLDTFPYNGGVTTMDGLWMGVPTVTLTGDRFVSRAGLSILSRVGLETFSAVTPDEYVQKAVSFAGQTQDLDRIRAALRPLMLHSDLCRPERIARELECAYRAIWRQWCRRPEK